MDYMPQFGQNVDQQMPQDDSMMQLELQRKLKLADALRNQAAPEGQMVSGHYVAPSWTQQLANLYGKYQAGQNEQGAIKQYGQYISDKQLKQANALRDLSGALKPVAETTQGSYDIQVPNGQTAGPTDNLGGMKPYESGMKTISVPMTTQTGTTRQPTADEITAAIGKYSSTIHDPALLEKVVMGQVTNALSPKQTEWKEVNGRLIGFDIHGKPTGQVIGEGKLPDYGTAANASARALFGKDFKDLSQPEQKKVTDYVNQFKTGQLDVARGNLGVNQQQANFNTGTPNVNQPQAKTTSVAEVQDYAKKHGISYEAAAQHANSLGYTVQ